MKHSGTDIVANELLQVVLYRTALDWISARERRHTVSTSQVWKIKIMVAKDTELGTHLLNGSDMGGKRI